MGEQVDALTYLGVPMIIIACALALLFVLNIIGSIFDFYGKVWPKIINFRRRRREQQEEKEKQKKLLEDVQKSLNEMKIHYSPEKLAERDTWMKWVNDRAKVYDDAIDKLLLLQGKLEENNEITLDLYINTNRNRILDFARMVADDNALVSQEEFNRIYKINTEYHAVLKKYNKENGEVDTAMRIINEAFDHRLKYQLFIEDIRGYKKK
jgi:hypothetical protein